MNLKQEQKSTLQEEFDSRAVKGEPISNIVDDLAKRNNSSFVDILESLKVKPNFKLNKNSPLKITKEGYPFYEGESTVNITEEIAEDIFEDAVLTVQDGRVIFSTTADLDIIESKIKSLENTKEDLKNIKCN